VVVANVAAGGMRSITLVQAMQYWLKLTAIAVPGFVLLAVWLGDGAPAPEVATTPGSHWAEPLSGFGGQDHPAYATYSTILALVLGTMGLPHVLVRFYTNPDGRAARRTTLTVVALLGLFYLFPPVYGVLGRVYLPTLPEGVRPDSIVLALPTAVLPGTAGQLLSAALAGGAFAAFLSTASGLTISVAGVIDQDLLRGRLRRITGEDATVVQGFRVATVLAMAVPYAAARVVEPIGLATTVGLAFAVAASTFCPLLVLGAWWRGLSTVGAAAGLVSGGSLAAAAVIVTMVGGPLGGWPGALLAQPAAWTIPIAFAVTVLVSLATPGRIPRHTSKTMVRLHTPEDLELDRAPGHR
jgi:cation/acetate symporter